MSYTKSDPDWIQTNDLLLRRQLLYSAELPGRNGSKIRKKAPCDQTVLQLGLIAYFTCTIALAHTCPATTQPEAAIPTL